MSSFPVCGTKEAREFGACIPADAVEPRADSIPHCDPADPKARDICISSDDAFVPPAEASCTPPTPHTETRDAFPPAGDTNSVGKGVVVAVAGLGLFATAAYAFARRRAAPAAANDNAKPEAVSVYDLPELDPREQLAFEIRGMFPQMSESRARMLANGAWMRWQEVPSATRAQLSTWTPKASYHAARGDAVIPMPWLTLYLRLTMTKDAHAQKKLRSQMAGVEAGAAGRVMWVSDAERAGAFTATIATVVDRETKSSLVFVDDVHKALAGQRWFDRLPADAKDRVAKALADRALELSNETTPGAAQTISLNMDAVMEIAGKAGMTVAFSTDEPELPSFPFDLEVRKLAKSPQPAEEKPLPAFDLPGEEKRLPSFKVEDSGALMFRRELAMIGETEMKMAQMDDLRELAPGKRCELAKRYLAEWRALPGKDRLQLIREAHARGDFCVGTLFLTVPSKAWIVSRFHAERETLRLVDYFESVLALSRSTQKEERAIARTWNILSEKVRREVFGGDVNLLADFVERRRGDAQLVHVREASATDAQAAPRIPTAAIVRELVERYRVSPQEAFHLVTTERPFFREAMSAWERYPAKHGYERGFAQFAAQRAMDTAAAMPARGTNGAVGGAKEDREPWRREHNGMPKTRRPGGMELPRPAPERTVK